MIQVLIFRTNLNDREDYNGFEYFDSGLHMTDEDKANLFEIAQKFYRSSLLSNETTVEFSIGEVLVKGLQHPTASRMKMIEGFINKESTTEAAESISEYDNRTKSLFDEFITSLFTIQPSSNTLREKDFNQLFTIIRDNLRQNSSRLDGNYLLYCNLQFLIETVYQDDEFMIGILKALQSIYKKENPPQ